MSTMRGATRISRQRRRCLQGLLALPAVSLLDAVDASRPDLRQRRVGTVSLPVIGLGTWRQLDLPADAPGLPAAVAALHRFLQLGGRVIDTSPMYGLAETRLGEALATTTDRAFIATKLWTDGLAEGRAQLRQSSQRIGRPVDLLQIHNLRDLDRQLRVAREAREAGQVQLVGVTHYNASAHSVLATVLQRERPDVLQVNCSLLEPQARERLLPMAADLGIAVLINRPFAEGQLFRRAANRPLPEVALALQCSSWAQLGLKWILAQPAVSCVLAGTSRVRHVEDNLGAARGPLPDLAQQREIESALA